MNLSKPEHYPVFVSLQKALDRSPSYRVAGRAVVSYNEQLYSLGRIGVAESEEVSERRRSLPIYHIVAGCALSNDQLRKFAAKFLFICR